MLEGDAGVEDVMVSPLSEDELSGVCVAYAELVDGVSPLSVEEVSGDEVGYEDRVVDAAPVSPLAVDELSEEVGYSEVVDGAPVAPPFSEDKLPDDVGYGGVAVELVLLNAPLAVPLLDLQGTEPEAPAAEMTPDVELLVIE